MKENEIFRSDFKRKVLRKVLGVVGELNKEVSVSREKLRSSSMADYTFFLSLSLSLRKSSSFYYFIVRKFTGLFFWSII